MKRIIQIAERLEKTFVVEAESEEEALEIAEKQYRHGNIVLYPDNYIGYEINDITDSYKSEQMKIFPNMEDVLEQTPW